MLKIPPKYRQIWGVVLAGLGAILFSTKAVLVKLAYQYEIDSVTLLLFRMIFSLPIYVGIAIVVSRKAQAYQPTKKDYFLIFLMGIMGFYLASLLDFIGLQYITASLERLVLFVFPTIVLLIGVFFFKEKITKGQILALILTYIGIAIVFIGNVDIASQSDLIIGSTLIFLCAVSYAIYIVGSGQLLPKLGTWLYTSYVLIISCVAVIVHYLIYHGGLGNFDYPYQVYLLALLMATISTVIPTLIISEGIRLIGSTNAAIVSSIGPISTITLAYIFLGERLGNLQIFGGVLVLGGVLFITIQKKRKTEGN